LNFVQLQPISIFEQELVCLIPLCFNM